MTKTWISDNCDNNYARLSAELKRPQIMFVSHWLAAVNYSHLTRYLQHSLEKSPGSFISTADKLFQLNTVFFSFTWVMALNTKNPISLSLCCFVEENSQR